MRSSSSFAVRLAHFGLAIVLILLALQSLSWSNRAVRADGYGTDYTRPGAGKTSRSHLTRQERIAYQYALEQVYWRHRIWPQENGGPKPKLEAMVPLTKIEGRVDDYLRKSLLLETEWRRPITQQELQSEIERMAGNTKQADMLKELWSALGNDPFVVAECLARPLLVDRLASSKDSRSEALMKAVSLSLPEAILPAHEYKLPAISSASNACASNSWITISTAGAPVTRFNATAVWTGSEMIVWGGYNNGRFMSTGGRYDPATDSWNAISTINAPTARRYHTAVWTGGEMIIWGGSTKGNSFLNSGGLYNPVTDSWVPTSTPGAPTGRYFHTSVWTGREMIVWGGNNGFQLTNTGSRYYPVTDTWAPIATPDNLEGRRYHTAVWTGSEMIVWGGQGNSQLKTGGRYNPSTDRWIKTSTRNAPSPRNAHTAVWTGSEMIVWGGVQDEYPYYLNTGGSYNPATNSWTATVMTRAPGPRSRQTGVWTGSEMIIWGGSAASGFLNTGGRYNPATGSWSPTSMINVPAGRYYHTDVWTGREMIVWGAVDNFGGRYCGN